MSGIVSSLFGAPSKNDSSSAQNSSSGYGALPGFAQDAYRQAVTGIQGLSANPSNFTPADFTPLQQQGFGIAQQGFTPLDADSVNGLTQSFMNPYTSSVVDSTNQQLMKANQGLLSQINGDASNAGAFGGSRQGAAQALQNQNTLNTIGSVDAGLNAQGYNTAQTNAINSLNQNNSNRQLQLSDLFTAGGMQQDMNTANKQAPLTALQSLLAAAQGLPATSVGSASSSSSATGDRNALLGSSSMGGAANILKLLGL